MADAKSKGAKVVVGGSRNESLGGLFFSPTVLSETTTEMLVSQEETFGPIASVMRLVPLHSSTIRIVMVILVVLNFQLKESTFPWGKI